MLISMLSHTPIYMLSPAAANASTNIITVKDVLQQIISDMISGEGMLEVTLNRQIYVPQNCIHLLVTNIQK